MDSQTSNNICTTGVLLVVVNNSENKTIAQDVYYKAFSAYGDVWRILIFDRNSKWKTFVEMDSVENAQRALVNLNNQELLSGIKMNIYPSELKKIIFQANNPGGVDYQQIKEIMLLNMKDSQNSIGLRSDVISDSKITDSKNQNHSSFRMDNFSPYGSQEIGGIKGSQGLNFSNDSFKNNTGFNQLSAQNSQNIQSQNQSVQQQMPQQTNTGQFQSPMNNLFMNNNFNSQNPQENLVNNPIDYQLNNPLMLQNQQQFYYNQMQGMNPLNNPIQNQMQQMPMMNMQNMQQNMPMNEYMQMMFQMQYQQQSQQNQQYPNQLQQNMFQNNPFNPPNQNMNMMSNFQNMPPHMQQPMNQPLNYQQMQYQQMMLQKQQQQSGMNNKQPNMMMNNMNRFNQQMPNLNMSTGSNSGGMNYPANLNNQFAFINNSPEISYSNNNSNSNSNNNMNNNNNNQFDLTQQMNQLTLNVMNPQVKDSNNKNKQNLDANKVQQNIPQISNQGQQFSPQQNIQQQQQQQQQPQQQQQQKQQNQRTKSKSQKNSQLDSKKNIDLLDGFGLQFSSDYSSEKDDQDNYRDLNRILDDAPFEDPTVSQKSNKANSNAGNKNIAEMQHARNPSFETANFGFNHFGQSQQQVQTGQQNTNGFQQQFNPNINPNVNPKLQPSPPNIPPNTNQMAWMQQGQNYNIQQQNLSQPNSFGNNQLNQGFMNNMQGLYGQNMMGNNVQNMYFNQNINNNNTSNPHNNFNNNANNHQINNMNTITSNFGNIPQNNMNFLLNLQYISQESFDRTNMNDKKDKEDDKSSLNSSTGIGAFNSQNTSQNNESLGLNDEIGGGGGASGNPYFLFNANNNNNSNNNNSNTNANQSSSQNLVNSGGVINRNSSNSANGNMSNSANNSSSQNNLQVLSKYPFLANNDINPGMNIGDYVNPQFIKSLRRSKVIYANWFDKKLVTLKMLINIFNYFGTVERIMYLKNKSSCLIEYTKTESATQAKESLNDITFMGQEIKIFYSNYDQIYIKNLKKDSNITIGVTEDSEEYYVNNSANKKTEINISYSKIVNQPSECIIITGLNRQGCNIDILSTFLTNVGPILKSKFILEEAQNICILKLPNREKALEAIALYNGEEICGKKVFIGFSKSKLQETTVANMNDTHENNNNINNNNAESTQESNSKLD